MRQPRTLANLRRGRQRLPGATLAAVALVGIVVAALATYVHYRTVAAEGGYRSFCTLSDRVDCTAVVLTPQSRLLGIPISILGVFTYLIVFGLELKGLWKGDLEFARSLALTTLIALGCTGYSVYLGYIVIAVVQLHCLLCYALYGVNLLLLLGGLLFAWRWRVNIIDVLGWEIRSILDNPIVAVGTALLALFCIAGAFVMRNVQRDLLIQRNPDLFAVFDGSARRVPVDLKNVPTLGPADADVLITEFNDFQCPFCRQSVRSIEEVAAKFPGRIRRQFMNLPLDKNCNPFISQSLHEGSCALAYAGRAAYLIGKFWEFHARAFSHVGAWSDATLTRLLVELGVPEDQVAARLTDVAVKVSVENDVRIARRLGIERTPSFIVNGMLIEGHYDPWLWERVIELELGRAEARRNRPPTEPVITAPGLPLSATDSIPPLAP